MINESNSTDALEATKTDLALGHTRETLSSKDAQIAMLEERLFKQSVELASLRAREDERQGSTKATSEDVQAQADLVDDGVKSSNRKSLFGFMPGWGSKARDSVISNIIKLDRSDKSEDLTVDFPAEGRRRTMDLHEHPTVTVNAAAVHFEEGAVRKPKRKSKRKSLKRLRDLVSLRKIGSTVLFPSADDDDSLGFE